MGPFQDFDTLPFGSSPTLQGLPTEYLSPPCWTRQSWRTSSFVQKAFHLQMICTTTPPLMNSLLQQNILLPFFLLSLGHHLPFIRHNLPQLKIFTSAESFGQTFSQVLWSRLGFIFLKLLLPVLFSSLNQALKKKIFFSQIAKMFRFLFFFSWL